MHPGIVTAAMEQTSEKLVLAGTRAQELVCVGTAAPLRDAFGARSSTGAALGGGFNSLPPCLGRPAAVACVKLRGSWDSVCAASLPGPEPCCASRQRCKQDEHQEHTSDLQAGGITTAQCISWCRVLLLPLLLLLVLL
jgi:hypothetical protein